MAKKVDHISLKKSTVAGKIPSTDVLVDGELAVNIAEGGEKIFLRNTKPEIVEFSSDKLLDKKYLSTTSGGTVNGETTFNKDVKIVYPDSGSTPVSLREVMVDNEMTVAAALNDLNERNDELSAKVTEQKTDIDNLSQKYLPLSGGTMSGNMEYSKTETEDSNDKYVTATYSDSIILDKRDTNILSSVGYNTLSLTNSEINLHEHSSSVGILDKDISINNRGLNVTNCGITLKRKNPIGPNYDTTTINGDSVNSPQFVKTDATAYDILLGDGTTKKVNDFLQISGGTVTGDTTFTKDVKVVFPNSETPTSLVGAIVSNEKVTSAALNNLNEKVDDHKSDIDNLKAQKNLPLSGGTVTGEATFSGGLKFGYPDVSSTPVSLRDVIADNEEVTAAALNDLNDKINKIGDISIANGVLIINDGNTKYKLNLEQLVTGGYATKE